MEYILGSDERISIGEGYQDVDVHIVDDENMESFILIRYWSSGKIAEGLIAIDETFNVNLVYGGLMQWLVRYEENASDGSRTLVAAKIGDDWYELLR